MGQPTAGTAGARRGRHLRRYALALLGNLLPQGNFDEDMRARQLNDMRADLLRAADRAQTLQQFRRYVRELRERKQAERDAEERRRAQDTVKAVP